MGTIAQKGEYLEETKEKIKDSINNLGGSITSKTTFREYAEELDEIYSNIPKATGEGTEVSLNTIKGKMSIIEKGNTEQDTRQYIDVGTWEQGGIDGTNGANVVTTAQVRTNKYIEVKPNILYEISRTIATDYMVFRFYDSNKNYLGHQGTAGMITTNRQATDNRMVNGVTTMQMTINNTSVAYMKMSDASNDLSTVYTIYTDNTPSPSYPQPIKSVTGNNTVVVRNSDNTQSQTLPLSLGNIELNKIGTYQDVLFKNVFSNPYYNADLDVGDWYKLEKIGKYVFTGNEGWQLRNTTTEGTKTYSVASIPSNYKLEASVGIANAYCNAFISMGTTSGASEMWTNALFKNKIGLAFYYFQGNPARYIYINTSDDLSTYLAEHTTTIKYISEIPTYTKITNTTLINQLEDIDKLQSYNGTTIITSTYEEGNSQMILQASGLKGE